MVSVSAAVRSIVSQNKLMQEALQQNILNYAAAAEKILSRVQESVGSNVKQAAIIMALRRYHETLDTPSLRGKRFDFKSEIIMKTGLGYLSFSKTQDFLQRLELFYTKLDSDRDTFNVIQGNYEIQIVTNEKYLQRIVVLLGKNVVKTQERSLVSISVTFGKEFAYTPGILFEFARKLYWDDVNIFELLTTATELTLLFQEKHAMKAYAAIKDLISQK